MNILYTHKVIVIIHQISLEKKKKGNKRKSGGKNTQKSTDALVITGLSYYYNCIKYTECSFYEALGALIFLMAFS
jgi:glucose uptake protein GlcU